MCSASEKVLTGNIYNEQLMLRNVCVCTYTFMQAIPMKTGTTNLKEKKEGYTGRREEMKGEII